MFTSCFIKNLNTRIKSELDNNINNNTKATFRMSSSSMLPQTSVMKTRTPLFRSTSSTGCSMTTATSVTKPMKDDERTVTATTTTIPNESGIQWWSNMAGVLLDRMNCTTCSSVSNAVVLEEDDDDEEKDESSFLINGEYPVGGSQKVTAAAPAGGRRRSRNRPTKNSTHNATRVMIAASKASCGVAVPDYYTSTADDHTTAWSMSRATTAKVKNDHGRLYHQALEYEMYKPKDMSKILIPPSMGTPPRNTTTSSSTRRRRKQRSNSPSEKEDENYQQRQVQVPPTSPTHSTSASSSSSSGGRRRVRPCETATTASMNTRFSVEDSLSNGSTTKTDDAKHHHQHQKEDKDEEEESEHEYIHLDEASLSSSTKELVRRHTISPHSSPPSENALPTIFRKEQPSSPVIKPKRFLRTMNPFAPAAAASSSSPPHPFTVPTATSSNYPTKTTSSPTIIRMDAGNYCHLPPTTSIMTKTMTNQTNGGHDDENGENVSTCSSLSSISSLEKYGGRGGGSTPQQQQQKQQSQTATTLRRLLMERRPLFVNQ